MKALNAKTLVELSGGEYSAYECFALGAGTALSILSGGPLGWLGGAILIGQAIEGGCF